MRRSNAIVLVAVVRTAAADAALLDNVPVMDGCTVARTLGDRLPALKLVALTGYGQASDRARTLANSQAGMRASTREFNLMPRRIAYALDRPVST